MAPADDTQARKNLDKLLFEELEVVPILNRVKRHRKRVRFSWLTKIIKKLK